MEKEHLEKVVRLYYRYKRTDNDKIRDFLSKVKLVSLRNNGPNTVHGYYPITGQKLENIIQNPRSRSLTFDLIGEGVQFGELVKLVPYKSINFLVKSSSRFFYKPDIGEVIDAIEFDDLHSGKIDAIDIDCSNFTSLPGTDGEHFICKINLLSNA